jgi:RND superfamily putative drug exporter
VINTAEGRALADAAGRARRPGDQAGTATSLGFATGVGLIAAVVVLLLSFGSLLAMGLPIVTALFGLGAGLGVIGLGSHLVDMVDFSSELALMIGLGVGIDYALFIVTRFRDAVPRERRQRPGPPRAGDEHGRPGDPFRRHYRRDRATRHVRARRQLLCTASRSPLRSACCSCSLQSLTLLPRVLMFTGKRVGRVRSRSRTPA